jgi:SnoaL-like domain
MSILTIKMWQNHNRNNMKNILLIAWMFFTIQSIAGQTPALNSEEEAVKMLVINEAKANLRGDYEAWKDCMVDAPQTSYANTASAGGAVYRKNYDEVVKAQKQMLAGKFYQGITLDSQDDWDIKVNGNMAWVRHTQHFTILMTKAKLTAFDLKVLEKIDGKWKISTGAWIGDYKNATPPMKSNY